MAKGSQICLSWLKAASTKVFMQSKKQKLEAVKKLQVLR